jgi:hypothetical protein
LELEWTKVSEDRLFGLVFPSLFLTVLVDTGKGTDESLSRYGKGIEVSRKISHWFWAVAGLVPTCWIGIDQLGSGLLDATAKGRVFWGIGESDGWCV